MPHGEAPGPVVQLRRRLKAKPEQIFDLWTKPDLMARWMSPFPGTVHCHATSDPRPGGAYSLVMTAGDASREVTGTYLRIDRPHLLVFTWIGPLTNNETTLVTVELNPHGTETELVLTHERLPTPAMWEGHTKGWGRILDHLVDALGKPVSNP